MTKPKKDKGKRERGKADQIARLPVLAPAVSVPMKPEELERLFPDDEVRRLKLSVLTSAEPRERITAIRRLVLAPGPVRDKGSVLLSALSDADPEVRLEAVKALVPLGLNPDVAREAQHLVSGSDKQKIAAAGRVGQLAAEAGPGEVSVLLTLVAGTLKTPIPREARIELVRSLEHAAPVLARDPSQLAGAVALLAEQLIELPEELARSIHAVLVALGREEPVGTVAALDAEIRRTSDRAARRQLLGAFGPLSVPLELRRPLAATMADELQTAPEPEIHCLGIANCLSQWGDVASDALLESVGRSHKRQKAFVLRLLDTIAVKPDCPAATKKSVAESFLAMLKTEPSTIRAVLLESEIFGDNDLPDALKAALAVEFIGHVHEFGGPRMLDVIERAVVRLGPPAIKPLVKLVSEGVRDRERVSAARVLGDLIAGLSPRGKNPQIAVDVLMTFVRQLDKPFPDRNALAASIGQMCTTRAMPADTVRRVARGLQVRVGKEPYSFGLLEGLGRLASSPNVELATRIEVAESLLRLIVVDLPEMQSQRTTGGEKTIFIAGREAAAYTDMIPILLDGLRNVCIHAGSAVLQDRLVRELLARWREASSWRLVWGPGNTLKLAEVLGEIALPPSASPKTRLRVTAALASSANVLPVLRTLGRLFAVDDASPEMGELAAGVADHLLDRVAPRSGDRIDLDATVTGTLAAIAGRKNLGSPDRAERLRTGIASVLFKALRNDAPETRQALRKLADSPAIGRKLQAEILERLGSQ